MKLLIQTKEQQAQGAFDGGRIRERKPIGFPQDRGQVKPYSNLFYWAHAWALEDSMIGEHPHKGFEIMSFVLNGNIEHYDSQLKGWKPLTAGDVQIIRAGSGISHAEKMYAGAELFQIWFDPGLERTLSKPATYNDHKGSDFQWRASAFGEAVSYVADEQGIVMDSKPLSIHRHRFTDGKHELSLAPDAIHSHFILGGSISIDGKELGRGDFFKVSETDSYRISTTSAEVFSITNSSVLEYRTYQEMMQARLRNNA